ncbi:hypothetical protein KI387_027636, partial [Taxus chinensis]
PPISRQSDPYSVLDDEYSIRYPRSEQRSQGMYPPVGTFQIQPEFSPQENSPMPSRMENTLRDAWQDSDQFIAGYHTPPQNHVIQQTPPRHDIVASPNEVISTLIEK